MPKFLFWNRIANANVAKARMAEFHGLPKGNAKALVARAMLEFGGFLSDADKTLLETVSQTLSKGYAKQNPTQPYQEPDPEPEERKLSSFSDEVTGDPGKLELTSSPPADLASRQSERLTQVTKDAIETFNASALVKRNGGALATVSETVGREKRQTQVRRFIRTARAICVERYGGPAISREFLVDFWAECYRDDFLAGRKSGGKGHENWLPDFEYLTREEVMLKVYDRAASEDVA